MDTNGYTQWRFGTSGDNDMRCRACGDLVMMGAPLYWVPVFGWTCCDPELCR